VQNTEHRACGDTKQLFRVFVFAIYFSSFLIALVSEVCTDIPQERNIQIRTFLVYGAASQLNDQCTMKLCSDMSIRTIYNTNH
jgi:hypothetical protein